MPHYSGRMDDDELAKLMREIEQFDSAPASPPANQSASHPQAETSQEVATRDGSGKGKWVAVAAATSGVGGLVVGSVLWFIPFVNGPSTALGAALGGAIAALVGQPPKWLK